MVIISYTSLNEAWWQTRFNEVRIPTKLDLPSYHIPGIQSKEIKNKIEKAISVSDIERILNQLISDKKINKEKLNQNIIKKLLEIKKLF